MPTSLEVMDSVDVKHMINYFTTKIVRSCEETLNESIANSRGTELGVRQAIAIFLYMESKKTDGKINIAESTKISIYNNTDTWDLLVSLTSFSYDARVLGSSIEEISSACELAYAKRCGNANIECKAISLLLS